MNYPTITFMSNPKTTAEQSRTYLYRVAETGPSYIVRVYIDRRGFPEVANWFKCDCGTARGWTDNGTKDGIFTPGGIVRAIFIQFDGCEHIRAAYNADAERFYNGVRKI